MPTPMSTLVANTQRLAMQKLAHALETTDDPAEIRRITELVIKLDPDEFDQPQAADPEPPLSEPELNRLRRLLPHMRPERFTKRHAPAYWRAILARQPPSQAVAA